MNAVKHARLGPKRVVPNLGACLTGFPRWRSMPSDERVQSVASPHVVETPVPSRKFRVANSQRGLAHLLAIHRLLFPPNDSGQPPPTSGSAREAELTAPSAVGCTCWLGDNISSPRYVRFEISTFGATKGLNRILLFAPNLRTTKYTVLRLARDPTGNPGTVVREIHDKTLFRSRATSAALSRF